MRVMLLPFEVEHRVDDVLEHLGARQAAVLGDVADEEGRDVLPFRREQQLRRGLAHLADAAGRGLELEREHRLDRIDDDQRRTQPRDLLEDPLETGFREQVERRPLDAQPLPARLDLMFRFLTGAVEHRSDRVREMRRRLQQQRGLADPRLAADQHQRSGHDAAAEHPIELVDPGRETRRHDSVDLFVEPRTRGGGERVAGPGAGGRRARARRDRHGALLDQRVPGAALGAAAEPLLRLRAALLAAEDDFGLHSLLRLIRDQLRDRSSGHLEIPRLLGSLVYCRSIRVPTRQSNSYGIVPIDAAISRMPISSAPCSPTITTSSPVDTSSPVTSIVVISMHTDADDGYAFSAYQHEGAPGHAAIEAVGVAGGDDGDGARAGRSPSAGRTRCLRRGACPSRARYGYGVTGQVAAAAVAASGGGTMP